MHSFMSFHVDVDSTDLVRPATNRGQDDGSNFPRRELAEVELFREVDGFGFFTLNLHPLVPLRFISWLHLCVDNAIGGDTSGRDCFD